jgi:ABC-type Na+ efflux pump permease subunit
MDSQTAYVPVAVPAEVAPKNPGRVQGIIGIVCAVISLLLLPPVFGVAGIILGVIAMNKGQKTLGLIAVILSAIFMVIGLILSIYVNVILEEGGSFVLGPILSLL